MGKNVLILSTSPRKNDNSEALADAFMQGAEETGNTVEKAACTTKKHRFLQWLPFLPKNKALHNSERRRRHY